MKKIVSVVVSIILLLNMSLAYTTQITVNDGGLLITSEPGNTVRIIPKIGIEGWVVEEGDVELNEESNSVASFTMPSENVSISNLILGVNSPNTLAAGDTWYTKGTNMEKSKITSIEIKDSYTPATVPSDSWDASVMEDGTVTAYLEALGGDTYKLTIAGNGTGKIFANSNSCEALKGFSSATTINGLKDGANVIFDTSNIINMESLFAGCSALTSIDVSGFNTSNVVDMAHLFSGCSSLRTINLSNFNTNKVTTMAGMFSLCSNLETVNISNFNTSNVTNMYGMFLACEKLESIDLSSFNTSNVTNMRSMFYECSEIESIDLRNFNTSNVTNMGSMFYGCTALASLDLSNFDTRLIEESGTADAGVTIYVGLSKFAAYCSNLTTIVLNENFGQNTNMVSAGSGLGMFYANQNLVTTVIGANDLMKSYDWATDNRTVTFVDEINTVTVDFNSNGGSEVNSVLVSSAGTYGELPVPTKTGYTFSGWYAEENLINEVTSETNVLALSTHTLYAKWESIFERGQYVTFASNNFAYSTITVPCTGWRIDTSSGDYVYAYRTFTNLKPLYEWGWYNNQFITHTTNFYNSLDSEWFEGCIPTKDFVESLLDSAGDDSTCFIASSTLDGTDLYRGWGTNSFNWSLLDPDDTTHSNTSSNIYVFPYVKLPITRLTGGNGTSETPWIFE